MAFVTLADKKQLSLIGAAKPECSIAELRRIERKGRKEKVLPGFQPGSSDFRSPLKCNFKPHKLSLFPLCYLADPGPGSLVLPSSEYLHPNCLAASTLVHVKWSYYSSFQIDELHSSFLECHGPMVGADALNCLLSMILFEKSGGSLTTIAIKLSLPSLEIGKYGLQPTTMDVGSWPPLSLQLQGE
jgi:hypothetical protein